MNLEVEVEAGASAVVVRGPEPPAHWGSLVSLDPWSMRGLCPVSLSLPKILKSVRKEAVMAVKGA